jgi:hypothetical protein
MLREASDYRTIKDFVVPHSGFTVGTPEDEFFLLPGQRTRVTFGMVSLTPEEVDSHFPYWKSEMDSHSIIGFQIRFNQNSIGIDFIPPSGINPLPTSAGQFELRSWDRAHSEDEVGLHTEILARAVRENRVLPLTPSVLQMFATYGVVPTT